MRHFRRKAPLYIGVVGLLLGVAYTPTVEAGPAPNVAGYSMVGSPSYPNDGLVNAGRIELAQDAHITCGVTNRAGTFGWFGMGSTPGRIVKVDLSDLGQMKKIQTIELSEGENFPRTAVIDGAEQFGYFAMDTIPARIVKVDLNTMTRVDALTLPEGEGRLNTAITNPEGTVAYFGTFSEPASIIRIDLETFERTGSLPLPAIESNLISSVADASGEFGYFGCSVLPGRIVKINLQNLSRVGGLSLTGVGPPRQGIIESTGLFAYFCTTGVPARFIRVDLSNFTEFDVLILPAGVDDAFSQLINAGGTRALLGLSDGRVARINLVNFTYAGAFANAGPFTGQPLVAIRPADLPDTGFFANFSIPASIVWRTFPQAITVRPCIWKTNPTPGQPCETTTGVTPTMRRM